MVRGSESAGGDGAAISHQDGPARRRGDEPPARSSVHDVPLPLGGSEGAQPPASPCQGPAKRGPQRVGWLMTANGVRSQPWRPRSSAPDGLVRRRCERGGSTYALGLRVPTLARQIGRPIVHQAPAALEQARACNKPHPSGSSRHGPTPPRLPHAGGSSAPGSSLRPTHVS